MDVAVVLLRLVAGLTLAAHGSQKLFGAFGGGGIAGTRTFFTGLGFRRPHLMALAAGTGELAGGLLLALGFPFSQEGRPGQVDQESEEEERRRVEARQRAEAEAAALEQLKEENPEAYAKRVRPEEEGEEGAEGASEEAEGEEPAEEES